MLHFKFIERTDRQHLLNHIREMVVKSQQVHKEELQQRRESLQIMLENEEKMLQNEFAETVKTRMERDIKARQEALIKIKEHSDKRTAEFLAKKQLQRHIEDCDELRSVLRHNDLLQIKKCQLEQIEKKHRALNKEKELDRYWQKVVQAKAETDELCDKQQKCLQDDIINKQRKILQLQIDEHKMKFEEEKRLQAKEAMLLKRIRERVNRDDNANDRVTNFEQEKKYRAELLEQIEEKRELREAERRQEQKDFMQLKREIKRMEEMENTNLKPGKEALRQSLLQFISFVQQTRQLDEQRQKMTDACQDDLRRIDSCIKSTPQIERRAAATAAAYAELKQQMCEQYQRRLQEEAAYKENKILKNYFIKNDLTREEIQQQRLKTRKELEQQMAEIKLYRKLEQEKFESELKSATIDAAACAQLAEKYKTEPCEFLKPHPNWVKFECSKRREIAKLRSMEHQQ